MRRLEVAFVFAALAAASSCGGGDTASPTSTATTGPTATAATTTTETTSPDPPSRTTPPDVTIVPPPTTASPATTTALPEPVTFGRPNPELLAALPADDIPWDAVDGEWLTLDHPMTAYLAATMDLDQRGLYLVDPDDRVYAVAALPANATDVLAVSAAGRVALLREPYSAGLSLGVLDLETTLYRRVIADGEEYDVITFTRDGAGLWVFDIPWTNPPESGGSFRLSRVDLADGAWTTLYEEPVELAELVEYYDWWVNNRGGTVELATGEVVFATSGGLWIGAPGVGELRSAGTLAQGCSIAGVWDDATLLVRCAMPGAEHCDCGPSGLWLVPLDDRPRSELALPDVDSCISYGNAVALDGHLAIDAGFGSGECNSHVVVVGPDGAEQWTPPIDEVRCNEAVLGVRNGAWLIAAANPYVGADFPLRLFEVTPRGATPLDLPAGRFGLLES